MSPALASAGPGAPQESVSLSLGSPLTCVSWCTGVQAGAWVASVGKGSRDLCTEHGRRELRGAPRGPDLTRTGTELGRIRSFETKIPPDVPCHTLLPPPRVSRADTHAPCLPSRPRAGAHVTGSHSLVRAPGHCTTSAGRGWWAGGWVSRMSADGSVPGPGDSCGGFLGGFLEVVPLPVIRLAWPRCA